jgi:hypothetical protein
MAPKEEVSNRVLAEATRPNGSLNVSMLNALAIETARPVLIRKLKAEAKERRRKPSPLSREPKPRRGRRPRGGSTAPLVYLTVASSGER